MINFNSETKCEILYTTQFKKQIKKFIHQNKNLDDLLVVINKLANLEELEPKYRNHSLINDKTYKNCKECHISLNWLLIYKYIKNNLIPLLVSTSSHSELFD